MTIEEAIHALFSRLAAGELSEGTGLLQEGWEAVLPSGRTVARSALQIEASQMIALGAEAVPCLLPWVLHANPALRYVAIYALEQITGEKARFPYFDPADKGGKRALAIAGWKRWYETNGKSAAGIPD